MIPPETRARILDLWSAGLLAREIAEQTGVDSVTSVVRHARAAGDPRAAWRGSGRRNCQRDEAMRAAYRQAHAGGLSAAEAARRLRCPVSTIRNAWARLGLRR